MGLTYIRKEEKIIGNKDIGRAINAMPFDQYITTMGGNIENMRNTGISFTNWEVFKYFKMLREYALGRIRWTSSTLPEHELKLIEWNIFHYGRCAMLRPVIKNNGVKFQIKQPRIYQCNYTDINFRNGRPNTISIINNPSNKLVIEANYDADEFVIFTDEFLFPHKPNPFIHVAWEFACKLHELDLAFNANSHRMRMPFVFNNGATEIEKDGTFKLVANRGISIAELMRSAYGRNEQFIEIPESMVGTTGFMHEPQHVDMHILELIEAQKKLYQAYLELLGLYTNKEKSGVYTIKDLQENGDESGDFITKVAKNNRLSCAREAALKFNIDLVMEVI